MLKLNVLLAKTDHLASKYVAELKNYITFFRKNQGAFMGEKRTYQPREGTVDDPSKRKISLVQTTVDEKFDWLLEDSAEYIDSLFSVEATNASGHAKAELIVDGDSWGVFTSLELLRLKSLLESADFRAMIESIPMRSDADIWNKTTAEMYASREIYETEMVKGVVKTTTKESYILEDPNIGKLKDSSQYTPQVSTKNTVEELGDYTHQHFTGAWSQRQRAEALQKRSKLLNAVIGALKECNEVEVVKSELTSEKILGWILK